MPKTAALLMNYGAPTCGLQVRTFIALSFATENLEVCQSLVPEAIERASCRAESCVQ